MSMAMGRIATNLDNPDIQERIASRMARRAFWDMYTLFGMQPLKTATKEEVVESATSHEADARGHLIAARFERAIAARLKRGQLVCDGLSSVQVEKIAVKSRVVINMPDLTRA